MITTNEDIRQWAEMIVAAKGEKFTPLTKGEQYLIAQYIMSSMQSSAPPDTPEPTPETPSEQIQMPPKAAETIFLTRGAAYHRAGFSAQEVFDKFLTDAKEHKCDTKVMDFSTGRQSPDAAFAYWLSQTIEIGIPPSARK